MDNNNGTPKKFNWRTLNWTRIAIILIIVGVVLFVVGWFSGGRGVGISFANNRFNLYTSATEHGFPDSFTPIERGGAIRNIYINTTSIPVTVRTTPAGERDGIYLRNVNPDSVTVTREGININTRRTERVIWVFGFHFGYANREIIVNLPAYTSADTLNIRSSSGRVEVHGLSADEAIIRSTSGRITVYELSANLIGINSTSGSLHLNDLQGYSIRAGSTSGSITINRANVTTFLSARSTSGSIRGENLEMRDGHMQSTSGSIRIDRIIWHDLSARSTSGSVQISDGQILGMTASGTEMPIPGSTTLNSTSGRVNLYLLENRENFSYSINTTSGGINVDGFSQGRGRTTGGNGDHEISIRSTSGGVRLQFR